MRNFKAELAAGGCKDGHGCNSASMCLCAFAEDAIAEIDRLTAEIERLHKALTITTDESREAFAEIDRLHRIAFDADDKRCQMQEENERLRAALVQIRGFVHVMEAHNWRDLRAHIEFQCADVPLDNQQSPAPKQVWLDWKISDECKAQIEEIERHIKR